MTVETKLGKITASKAVLNAISLMADFSSDRNFEKGYTASGARDKEISNEIYHALKSVGYYEGI